MIDNEELPVGFMMELARHPAALDQFARLSEQEQQSVAAGARSMKSRSEMRQYVESMNGSAKAGALTAVSVKK